MIHGGLFIFLISVLSTSLAHFQQSYPEILKSPPFYEKQVRFPTDTALNGSAYSLCLSQ